MVSLNCGAMPEALLESELFGHMRGAFTSAESNKKGLLEVAEKGTIFLDEIGEMTGVMQVKLLRVLQERRFRRVGGLEFSPDLRVIAATNQGSTKASRKGGFAKPSFTVSTYTDRAPSAERARETPRSPTLSRKYASDAGRSPYSRPARTCSATTGPATSGA